MAPGQPARVGPRPQFRMTRRAIRIAWRRQVNHGLQSTAARNVGVADHVLYHFPRMIWPCLRREVVVRTDVDVHWIHWVAPRLPHPNAGLRAREDLDNPPHQTAPNQSPRCTFTSGPQGPANNGIRGTATTSPSKQWSFVIAQGIYRTWGTATSGPRSTATNRAHGTPRIACTSLDNSLTMRFEP